MWSEVLMTLLQTMITAAIPVLTIFLCRFLLAKKEELKAKTNSAIADSLLDEAYSAVSTAVTYVNQVYVDGLKKSDKFTKENQMEAFNMAKEAALSIISTNAQEYIKTVFGSLDVWLAQNIEAQVNLQK